MRGTGAIFLGGPPLVKAATGEDVTVEELGGADVHTGISGTADYPAASEEQAIAIAREHGGARSRDRRSRRSSASTPEAPYYDPEELYGIIPRDIKVQFDMREVIARLVDGSRFHEYQPAYGTTLVCGFAASVGLSRSASSANNGVLFNDCSLKGAHFMQLCNQRLRAADLSAEHHRLHGGARLRAPRHHQGRREDDHGGRRAPRCRSSP